MMSAICEPAAAAACATALGATAYPLSADSLVYQYLPKSSQPAKIFLTTDGPGLTRMKSGFLLSVFIRGWIILVAASPRCAVSPTAAQFLRMLVSLGGSFRPKHRPFAN